MNAMTGSSKPGKGKGLQGRMQDIGFEFADPEGQFPADQKDAESQAAEPTGSTKKLPSSTTPRR
jgi:hypothetical protein